ncbi:hypothetical protein A1351_21395 [Methylosinus sp. R-45379]|nr:hypothetical protein A1351_21395 [Methylosinus sp. R-45379]
MINAICARNRYDKLLFEAAKAHAEQRLPKDLLMHPNLAQIARYPFTRAGIVSEAGALRLSYNGGAPCIFDIPAYTNDEIQVFELRLFTPPGTQLSLEGSEWSHAYVQGATLIIRTCLRAGQQDGRPMFRIAIKVEELHDHAPVILNSLRAV